MSAACCAGQAPCGWAEQIDIWKLLPYGQIGRGRAVMFDLADNDKLKSTATSEDSRVLDALAHAQRHQTARGECITVFNEEGEEIDISFATQNWRKGRSTR